MPDMGHVIDCARFLKAAHAAFERMLASGDDGGRALGEEIRRARMGEAASQAAQVWVDFLLGLRDPGVYGNEGEGGC